MSRFAVLVLVACMATGCPRGAVAPPSTTSTTSTTSTSSSAESAHKLCEHGVPASLCTKCHPELAPVFQARGDWCAIHGVPKSHCLQCDPSLRFDDDGGEGEGAWCDEHGVPEAMCTKCHPALVARFIAAGDYCRAHGFPASVCPHCHPELPAKAGHAAPVFPPAGTRVRLASRDTAGDAGLETMRVALQPFAQQLEVAGRLELDGNALAQVSARDEARVLEVLVDIGDVVKAGAGLVVLASGAAGAERAQLAASQAKVDAARAALERLQQLADVSARKSLEEARRDLAVAVAENDAAQAALAARGIAPGAGARVVLTSPLAGTVVARDAVPGRTARPEAVLVQVANTRRLWATLDVPEGDAARVQVGQKVHLRFEGAGIEPREAVLVRVGASVDPSTRTVLARIDVDNADGRLKAGSFVRARIDVTTPHPAIVVPQAAVQRAEEKSLVFVVREPSVYEPVTVTLGAHDDKNVEILTGLTAGDEVVTTGAFLLKTEILKSSIGAGCCDDR